MSKPLHPSGKHRLKLVNVLNSRYGELMAQCIFAGTGPNKGCYTLSRLIAKIGRWKITSYEFLDQLEGFNHENDIVQEIRKFIGQDFDCVIPKQGSASQMNISRFPNEFANINSKTHVNYASLPDESQVVLD